MGYGQRYGQYASGYGQSKRQCSNQHGGGKTSKGRTYTVCICNEDWAWDFRIKNGNQTKCGKCGVAFGGPFGVQCPGEGAQSKNDQTGKDGKKDKEKEEQAPEPQPPAKDPTFALLELCLAKAGVDDHTNSQNPVVMAARTIHEAAMAKEAEEKIPEEKTDDQVWKEVLAEQATAQKAKDALEGETKHLAQLIENADTKLRNLKKDHEEKLGKLEEARARVQKADAQKKEHHDKLMQKTKEADKKAAAAATEEAKKLLAENSSPKVALPANLASIQGPQGHKSDDDDDDPDAMDMDSEDMQKALKAFEDAAGDWHTVLSRSAKKSKMAGEAKTRAEKAMHEAKKAAETIKNLRAITSGTGGDLADPNLEAHDPPPSRGTKRAGDSHPEGDAEAEQARQTAKAAAEEAARVAALG